MPNSVVTNTFTDTGWQQAAQVDRTQFTPGKATSSALDENWPTAFNVPVGNSQIEASGGVEMLRLRQYKTGRNIISDDTIPVPVSGTDVQRGEEGSAHSGVYVFTPTDTQDHNGNQERDSDYEYPNI